MANILYLSAAAGDGGLEKSPKKGIVCENFHVVVMKLERREILEPDCGVFRI